MGTTTRPHALRLRRPRLDLHVPDRLRELPWRVILLVAAGLLALVAAVAPLRTAAANTASRAMLFMASPLTPDIKGFDRLPQTTKVLAADGTLLAELDDGQRREPVRLDDLPDHVPHAVLAAEDANFYHHGGVDLTAIVRATVRNVQGDAQGGSTITQQLAKLNYTGSQRTVLRKLKEVLYARRLEQRYTKDELLERYLNQVYFGDGAYGIAAAAETYFGVTPDELTPAQAAMLAGKIRSPETLDPRRHPEAMTKRRNQVLHNMAKHGWLDKADLGTALASPIETVPAHDTQRIRKAAHFVRYVQREALALDALGGSRQARGKRLFTGGLTIHTTLDAKAFDAAENAARTRLGAPDDPTAAVVTVQPGNGAIRNLFGGLDPNRKFDVATQGRRQPGSAFKPFVYLAAIEAGIDPRSTLDSSSPMTLDWKGSPYVVDNYEGHGRGRMSIDDALVDSVNTVYAQLGIDVGPENVVTTAEKAGIPPGIKPLPAIALGGLSRGVSPLEMAAAYATFAAKGVYATPYAIASISDADGHQVYAHSVQTREAFDAREVGNLNRPLQQVVQRGTGTAAAIGRPVAGKTGTTQNYTNGWFIGYTPQLATAVWVGNPDRDEPLTNVHGRRLTGGSFPALLFSDTMKVALAGERVLPLAVDQPDALSLKPLQPPTSLVPQNQDRGATTPTSDATVADNTTTTAATDATAPTTTVTQPPPSTSTTQPTPTTQASAGKRSPTTTSTTAPPP